MNERIRELADQAELTIQDSRGNTYMSHPEFNKKFARLIVLECVNAVMDGTKEGDHYAQRIENHFDNGDGGILHFGVEE